MAKIVLDTVTGGYDLSVINNNFDKIETEFQNKVLYRDNPVGEANTLQSDMDVNGKSIYNLPAPLLDSQAARLQDVKNAIAGGAANLITFTPYGHVSGNNLQAAIQELIDDTTNNGVALPAFLKDSNAIVVDSIAALKALDKTKFTKALVLGYYTKGDGGGGVYWYDSSDITSVDNSGTVIVATDLGRWKLIFQGAISVKQFGAKGDGVTDDTVAIQKAVDTVIAQFSESIKLLFPQGEYVVSASILINGKIDIEGFGQIDEGTVIKASASLNAPIFDVSARCEITSISFKGTFDVTKTGQNCIRLRTANSISLKECFFQNAYDNLVIDGTAAVFYADLYNCSFDGCKSSHLKIDNTNAAGVDLIMDNCRFLGNMGAYCWWFAQGLGSIIASNIQISVTGTGPTNQLCYFGTPATLYGGAQFNNCVFENLGGATGDAIRLAGTALLPWKEIHFTNCLLTSGGAALNLVNVDGAFFTNCTFSGSSATEVVLFAAGTSIIGVTMTDCSFESSTSAPVMLAAGSTTVGLSVTNPRWKGSSAFINFASVPAAQLELTVRGGDVGSAASPILLGDYKNTPKDISVIGDNYGPQQRQVYVGTLDGAGAATVAHGITSGQLKIVQIDAWYRGSFGEMLPLTVVNADGTNISVSGGTASAKYRISVLYNVAIDTNW